MIVEISSHGSSISKKYERFIIRTPDAEDYELPAKKVEAILVSSNANITTGAIRLCAEHQIQLVILSYGKIIGRFWSSTFGRQTQIRRQQYMNVQTELAFKVSKKLLLEKIKSQKKVLFDLRRNRTDIELRRHLEQSIKYIDGVIVKVDNMLFTKDYSGSFLGLEGSCANTYFEMISKCLPNKWRFKKRTQNPGLDPFNASLNYMYGITYAEIEKSVIIHGLDPHAGFYHKDSYGKPTLVFDIIEPCRPVIDKALISLFNKKITKDEWFSESEHARGVELTKDGRSGLISCYRNNCQKTVKEIARDCCKSLVIDLLELDKTVV